MRPARLAAPALLLALAGAWEAYVRLGGIDPLILPPPTQVAEALWVDRALLAPDLAVTALEVGLGLLVAVVVAIAVATLVHFVPPLRTAVAPLVVGSQALPIPVVAPLVLVWLGFGLAPKLVIVALVCFFPIVVGALDGLASTSAEQRRLLRSLDATRWQAFRFVEAPAALPPVLTGAKVAVTVAVIGAVLAEVSGADAGLGHLVQLSLPQFQTARAYAAVALLVLLAVALYAALEALERALVPWARPRRRP